MSLQIVSGPTAEPVTVQEVKDRLRLSTATDDAMIGLHITAAREYAEKMTRRSLAYKSYAYFLNCFPFPCEPIRLPVPPVISVSAIKYLDATGTQQTWDKTEYYVAAMQSPALIIPNPAITPAVTYPDTGPFPGAVEIDFTAGYGYPGASGPPVIPPGPVCPEHLKEGIRQLAVHIYEHPEAVTSEGLKEAPLALRSFFRSNQIYIF